MSYSAFCILWFTLSQLGSSALSGVMNPRHGKTNRILLNSSAHNNRRLRSLLFGPMRPNPESLPRAGRLHAPVPLLRGCGCPPYLRTANTLRTKLLHTKAHRPSLPFQPGQTGSGQKRWITQQHIQRMEEARLDWLRRAKEIKDGKRQSFIEHLESRGLIHDVVGCVALDCLQLALS